MSEFQVEKLYELTPMQEGILYHKLLNEESTEYVSQTELRQEGLLDVSVVHQALSTLSIRHEVLRTAIVITSRGKPWQVILQNREVEVDVKLVSTKEEVELLKREDVKRGFDLKEDSLLRVTIIESDGESILLWTAHHIIIDGWCLALLYSDFLKYYKKLASGCSYEELAQEIEKENEESGSYQDYIRLIEQKDKASGLKYWEELLAGYEEAAIIQPIQAEETGNEVERLSLEIDKELSSKLLRLSQKEKITMSTITEAAWGIVLQKYNQTYDVVFGKVVSGRNVPVKGIEKMVGLFINTIPLRVQSDEYTTIRELLQDVHKQGLASSEYDYCSLAEVQGRSDLGQHLFSTLFLFQNYYVDERVYDNSQQFGTVILDNRDQTNYSLSVLVYYAECLRFNLLYDPRIYGKEEVELVLNRLVAVLKEIAFSSDKTISEIDILTESERNQLLYEFNDTYADYQRDKTIHEMFEEQVIRTPDNIAIVCGEESMTYSELNAKSNQLARLLRDKGVQPDDIVGIILERSFEMIVGIMGILKSGGAYLPLDPEYPKERIQFMLEDSSAEILLSQSWLGDEVEFGGKRIDIDEAELYEGDISNLIGVNSSNDLAYVIYTSGSTGMPKGVMVEHQAIINRLIWMQSIYSLAEDDVILQKTTYTFDVSVWEILWWSFTGASVCMLAPKKEKEPAAILQSIKNNNVTVMHFVPSMLSVFLEYIKYENESSQMLSLRRVFASGEELGTNQVQDFYNVIYKSNGTDLVNLYGPTEAAVDVTYFDALSEPLCKIIPIGKPISNISMYILGNNDALLSVGIPGELCISGEGLARGYLNRPDLTSEKFVPNPFKPGERIYRTGDLARWLPDGNIEFLGRIDHQVKIRGFRIELGEIESRLLELDEVKEAVVLAKDDDTGDKYICAYIVPEEELNLNDMRTSLSSTLPDYMIPLYFMHMDSIPLTPNGKVDRKALPEPEGVVGTEYVAPRTDEEKVVAEAFSAILGIRNIGATDDFFALGGDSIKAIRVISKLRGLGYDLSVRDLMMNSVVELVSRALKSHDDKLLYEQGEVVGEVPLTPVQEWFFESFKASPNHFNQAIMLKTVARLDKTGITAVLRAIVQHHDMLRVVYRDGNQALFNSRKNIGFDLFEYDYIESVMSKTELEKEIQERSSEIQASINIITGPLMKVALFRTEKTDYIMVCVHHLIIDGISWHIFMEDLETGYRQYLENAEIKFSKKTASYKDWAEALGEYSSRRELYREISYWRDITESLTECQIKSVDTGKRGDGIVEVALDSKDTNKLLYEVGKVFGTEINDLLLSSLGVAVYKLTNQSKVAINLEGHGREVIHKKIDIDRTMGWFTSIYPVIIESSDNIKETIIKTKEMLRKIPNKGLGYGVLKYLAKEDFGQEEAQITFNYLGSVGNELDTPGGIFTLSVSEYSVGRSVAIENVPNDICINCLIVNAKLKISIQYQKSKFEDEKMLSLAELYIESLRDIIRTCVEQTEIVKTSSDYGLSDEDVSQDMLEKILTSFK